VAKLGWTEVSEEWQSQPGESWEAFYNRGNGLFKALQAASQAVPEGTVKGRMIGFPVADGAAYYLVLEEKPLTLEHIPYGDGYEIPKAHVRGLNLSDVRALVQAERVWEQMRADGEGRGLIPRERAAGAIESWGREV
jgi:hypothetical protein